MATLLQGVNAVGKRAKFLDNATELASLTNTAKQLYIDLSIQTWNEAIVELYDAVPQAFPDEATSSTITLVTDDRDYALATDLVKLHWPLHDQTNGRYIYEWKAGFINLEQIQITPADQTGIPLYGAIRPTDGQLYLDRLPTSTENGLVYTYYYDKDILVSAASDTFPFNDTVYNMLIPAVAEKVKLDKDNKFVEGLWAKQMGLAARHLSRGQRDQRWVG